MTIIEDGIDLGFLVVPKTSFVADPALADSVEIEYGKITPAHPTHDPNRMTVHVPTDKAVLSLGAPSPTAWKTDKGITGYTNSHIHFETKKNDKTIVSLGGPAATTAITGHGGKPPKSTEGYSMVTAERAWHEANGQHYLLSHTKDISIRTMGGGKRAVVQADAGHVDLNGGEEVCISGGGVAIGAAAQIHIENVEYDGEFSGKAPSSSYVKIAKKVMDPFSAAFSVHDLGLKLFKTVKKIYDGKMSWDDYFFADVLKWGTDAYKFYKSIGKLKKLFQDAPSPPGCVKIGAEKNIGAVAGGDISLAGASGASLSSAGSASISAVMNASLKGGLFAGVGGTLTSIKGQKRIEVSSPWGDVNFSAKSNIGYTAEEEWVGSAVGDAQVTGTKHLLFGAAKRAWMGAEHGWGAHFDDKGVAFGKASGAGEMKSAAIENAWAIRIDDDKIEIAADGSALTLTNDLCLVEAPAIRIEARQKNVSFKCSRATID